MSVGRSRCGGGETSSLCGARRTIKEMEWVQTLIGGLIGGGLIGFIEFLIRRHDSKADRHDEVLARLDDIDRKLGELDERMDRENADDSRRRILAFDDSIRVSTAHSEESFNQIMEDINTYEQYCKTHEKYENSKATNAIININEVYRKVKLEDRFI